MRRAAALREAKTLLAEASLPPRAQRQASEPPGADGQLAHGIGPRPANPLLVRAHAFWVVPSSSRTVFEWAKSHEPANVSMRGETDNEGPPPGLPMSLRKNLPPSLEEVFYGWNPRRGPVLESGVTVAVVPSAREPAYVRVEAYVGPRVMRPKNERVPTRARLLRITAIGPMGGHGHQASPPPIRVEDAAKVREVARMIDSLPRAQPGAFSCPMDNGSSVTFAFKARAAGPVLALVKADATGCGSVSMRIADRTYPELGEGPKLIQKVKKLLGPRAAKLPR